MAEQRFVKGTEEYVMFNDFWKLCQAFWIPEDTDEYWKKLHDAAVDFQKENEGISLSSGLSFAFEITQRCIHRKNDTMLKIILDYMHIAEKHYPVMKTDDYWESLHDSIVNLVKKHNNDSFAKFLGITMLHVMEEELKKQEV